MSSTIETLERELGEAQREREEQQRAVIRAENAHEAVCAARDDAWSAAEDFAQDDEVERLSALVYQRRRELYEAIDRLKAAEGKERRIKSRLMYVLPAERRRYLSGTVDEEFERLLLSVRHAYSRDLPGAEVRVVTEKPGELDLRGDATWRALERLYSGTVRRWVEIRTGAAPGYAEKACAMAHQVAYYAGGHLPRVFVGGEEIRMTGATPGAGEPRGDTGRPLAGFDGEKGQLALARITARRYLDETSVARLSKRAPALVQISEIARLYQTMNLTGDEIRWRLEQLISLRLDVLEAVYTLTGEKRRFSFYEIARAARLLDGHFPDAGVAAEALSRAVNRAVETGVPLVDVAYLSVTSGEGF
ncbi:hypothetical protein GBA65_11555 [Rubrobacter marinus]|uniref:ATPases with chaperone activity, ATP-binding subunit n=1 Tax=Rubrobacter marinus TaxID=2653852 RepID=A0A6G8PXY6_9ACTN|nr:hypothetical protein [Rubrobacter marinus]QIN79050.1 hypothetical protein GBA65_11555 [Rubrobacter marinus]